jgi:hypothetical protein
VEDLDSKILEGFWKIVRPRNIKKKYPLEGNWDPYLSDFFHSVSTKINNKSTFFPDLIDLNKKNVELTTIYKELSTRVKFSSKSSASVLVGKVGTGKTSFLNWFRNRAERKNLFITRIDYNLYPTPPSNKRLKDYKMLFTEIFESTVNKFNKYLVNKMQNDKIFRDNLEKKILELKKKSMVIDYPNWEAGFISQTQEFSKNFPNFDKIMLLTTLICCANETFKKPVWMIIDNIDRLPPLYQRIVVQVAHNIYEYILENSRSCYVSV